MRNAGNQVRNAYRSDGGGVSDDSDNGDNGGGEAPPYDGGNGGEVVSALLGSLVFKFANFVAIAALALW